MGLNRNQIWNRTWGGIDAEAGNSVWGEGTSIFTCGFTKSFGAGNDDLCLTKWDSNGNLLWNRTWGSSSVEVGSSIWGDETFIYTCGSTNGFGREMMIFVLRNGIQTETYSGTARGGALLLKWDLPYGEMGLLSIHVVTQTVLEQEVMISVL